MTSLRQTGINSYRRFVSETVVRGFRDVFSGSYTRDRQLQALRVTQKYPLTKVDYPALVVEYVDRKVVNAGVGHSEFFPDNGGVLREWQHSRFEGMLNLSIYALSPVDRDLLADAVVDCLRHGRLDAQTNKFFLAIYGDPAADNTLIFQQLMLNSDEIFGQGNNASLAPWSPEDQLVYATGYSLEIHGGFYNTPVTQTYAVLQGIDIESYPQGELPILVDVGGIPFTNPFDYDDNSVVSGTGVVVNTGLDVPVVTSFDHETGLDVLTGTEYLS